MHLRRAMLLFAIVLALAALAAAVSRPADRRPGRASPPPPSVAAERAAPASRLAFSADGRPRRLTIQVGHHAVVVVKVSDAGQVDLGGLGLSAPADPLTPARFDVLPAKAGCDDVRFTPAGTIEARSVGALVVTSRGSARSGARPARKTGRGPGTRAARGSAAGRCTGSS